MSIDSTARGLAARAVAGFPQPYLGVVATRGYCPVNFYGGPTNIMSRTKHIARDTLSSVKAAFTGFQISAQQGEKGTGAPSTVTASIEYPLGTFTQLKFGTAVQGQIPDGDFVVSDFVSLPTPIPPGAAFYVRNFWSNPTGVLFTGFANGSVPGEGAEIGSTDKTMSGTIAAAAGPVLHPLAIIAPTLNPSIMLIGDSIMFGVQDTLNDLACDQGIVARSVGPHFGYTNFGCPGDTIAAALAKGSNRLALSKYYSTVVSDYGGVNDNARGAPAVIADMQTLGGLYAGLRRFNVTRVPSGSNSTDGYATVANQSGANAGLLAINQAVRAGMPNWDDFFDVGAALESAPESGLWTVGPNGSGAVTSDGTHPNLLGNVLILRSGAVRPEAFRR